MEKRRSLINIGLVISMLVGAYATLTILNTRPAHAFIFSDPSGDTDGPDITQMEYDVVNDALELKLTFVQKLAGDVINQDLLASIHIDIDKSLMTGFIGGGGLQSQFGMDYEIEIELLGFGPSSNTATLKYWRYKLEEPFIKLDRVSVPLGNLFYPNGSIFVAGYNENYGTDNHQIFMSIPVTLFANTTFPICTDVMELCINQIFPCPLPLTPNLNNAYINLSVISFGSFLMYPASTIRSILCFSSNLTCFSTNSFRGISFRGITAVSIPSDAGYSNPFASLFATTATTSELIFFRRL